MVWLKWRERNPESLETLEPAPRSPMIQLEKLLARNLGCSRKEARRLLATSTGDLPREVPPAALPLHLDLGGRALVLRDACHLVMHKPAGCVTALSDHRHPTVTRYVGDAPLAGELRPVGRLDLDTTGLLVWTTDGEWLHRLIHPRTAPPRRYHAALARPHRPLRGDLVLRDGHRPQILDLRPLPPDDLHPALLKPGTATAYASITIAGGAYHEVRRIFAALDSHVLALCRVSFGGLELPRDLPAGGWREVAQSEVDATLAT
jgi:16S rRNA pseudouridine516 synthase